jgi:hypothetical protein
MKFKELKEVINRHPGRHDKIAITIGLGNDAIIEAESPLLDCLDDYEVAWIAPETVGNNIVTDSDEPCIDVHLKEKKEDSDGKNTSVSSEAS